jgi:hypothetical protein
MKKLDETTLIKIYLFIIAFLIIIGIWKVYEVIELLIGKIV